MARTLSPVMVGRHPELLMLEVALDDALAGRGGVTVISGEAGIGKSRLAHEIEARAASLGMRVLVGRAVHAGAHIPFRPLAEAFHSVLRLPAALSNEELEPFQAALGRLAPASTGSLLGVDDVAGVLPEAVVRLLRVLSKEQGLLLVLEDLHWADADSLAVIEYLADSLAAERVLLICTERSDWVGAAAEVLGDLVSRRSASRLVLHELSEEEVQELANLVLDVELAPAAVVGALRQRAGGVPFLIEEMLYAYVAAAGSTFRSTEWWISRRIADSLPPSYRELVRARLAHLDEDGRRVVYAAAVLGRTFEWPRWIAQESLRFGIAPPNWDRFGNPRDAAELGRVAEKAGWDGYFTWDAVSFVEETPRPTYDPWVVLSSVAVATERIRIGTCVAVLPRYKPHLLAMTVASLDVLSGGRPTLGVGIGDGGETFEVFGESGDARIRAEKLDEGLEVITRLWSGDKVSHRGTHYEVRDVVLNPLPVQQPRVPIWVGGDSLHALRRAARWDGWIGPDDIQKRTTPKDLATIRRILDQETDYSRPVEIAWAGKTNPTMATWSRPTGGQVQPGGSRSSTAAEAAMTKCSPASPKARPARAHLRSAALLGSVVCSFLLRIRVFGAAWWSISGSADAPGRVSFRTILVVGCPRGPIPFVGRVSAGTARTNARSTHESVPVIYLHRGG